ncbi:hypothetical protein D3C81_1983390 [compost metagenome]
MRYHSAGSGQPNQVQPLTLDLQFDNLNALGQCPLQIAEQRRQKPSVSKQSVQQGCLGPCCIKALLNDVKLLQLRIEPSDHGLAT